LYEFNSLNCDSYDSNSFSNNFNVVDLESDFFVVPTLSFKNLSILELAGLVSNWNLSISILKKRNLRSSSSQRLTYVTYLRWNGVKSGFN